jgi:hypothetical protein
VSSLDKKPYFFKADYYQVALINLNNNKEVFSSNNKDLVLTEIKAKVSKFNARQRARIIKQSQRKGN